MRTGIFLILVTLLTPTALAGSDPPNSQGTGATTVVPEPPPPPENYSPPAAPGESGTEQPEPEVTITTKGTDIHEEYRLNGRLYMIKVTPAKGKPYYLIDEQGTGQFHRSDMQPHIAIPMWVIKRF